jgi:hypothetical protein
MVLNLTYRGERLSRRVAKLVLMTMGMGASDSDASVVFDGGDVHSVGEEGSHELNDANSRPAKSNFFFFRMKRRNFFL